VRGGPRTLIAVLAALLLIAGLAACGGGDDSSTSSTATGASAGEQSSGTSTEEGKGGAEDKSGSGEDKSGGSGSAGSDDETSNGASSGGSGNFTPRQHSDSGGGSEQFRTKGGDNSIQDYGEEGDASELDAAASTLHNFLDARAAGDPAAACEYMSKAIIESFKQLAAQSKQTNVDTSCAGLLETLTNPAAKQSMQAEADAADVHSLRIEDERAFVIYTGIGGTVFAMPMANEDGAWKVASIAGTPIS
jgi:hypothetical protein